MYTAINTQEGLYQYNALPFGVSSTPAIFQHTMEGILEGIPQVRVYTDDILITGVSDEEHLRMLDEILLRLANADLNLKLAKCFFMQASVEYLGHRISAERLQTMQEKFHAITKVPTTFNVTQLRSFLGLIKLQWEVPSQPCNHLSPSLQAVDEEGYLDLGT